nr:MAG TPA: hypothetical protein [Caudoviricetes sp.]
MVFPSSMYTLGFTLFSISCSSNSFSNPLSFLILYTSSSSENLLHFTNPTVSNPKDLQNSKIFSFKNYHLKLKKTILNF